MVLVMRDESEECSTQALTSLVQAESVREMIEARFIFAGFTLEHPPIEQLANLISLGQNATDHAALYFLVVSHDAKVQLLRRQLLTIDTTQQDLYTFSSECLNLFTILAEEDPGYLQ